MIREPDELHWEVHERGGLRFYRIHPADREPTRRRIERVIARWDEHDVAIGIVPELCLSHDLLECWQAALRGRERAAASRLRLVLAGSGNVERSTPPANTAVLLDASTGETVAQQPKIHPFNFSPEDLERWRLSDRLSGADRRGPQPRGTPLRDRGRRRAAGDPGVRGPRAPARLLRDPPFARRLADPRPGVRAADEGPPLGARAGRGLQRRHRLDRGRGEQPGDGRDPGEPDSGRHGDRDRPRPRRDRTCVGAATMSSSSRSTPSDRAWRTTRPRARSRAAH